MNGMQISNRELTDLVATVYLAPRSLFILVLFTAPD